MQFTQGLHRAVQQRPQAVATVCGTRVHSFAQVHDRVARLAGGLLKLGVKRHDRVAILSLNSDRYLECYLACAWIGAVVNPINFRWSIPEVVYSIVDSQSKVLITDDQFAPQATTICQNSPCIEHQLFIGDNTCPSNMTASEELIACHQPVADAEIGHDGACPEFCVNGPLAGNCRLVRRHDEHQETRRT